jgi:hypothetical protein
MQTRGGEMIAKIHLPGQGVSTSTKNKFRKERFNIFISMFRPGPHTTILDVGGAATTWIGTGLESQVTLLNITKPKECDRRMGFRVIQCSGLEMKGIEDGEYDIVFSNSVIEHVGDLSNQMQFAREVRRVGKSYWIQTPNRYFPVEPHFRFPLFQFLPATLQHHVATSWNYSHFKKFGIPDDRILAELADIRLLSESDFKSLFPDGSVINERWMGLCKSLVAVKKPSAILSQIRDLPQYHRVNLPLKPEHLHRIAV